MKTSSVTVTLCLVGALIATARANPVSSSSSGGTVDDRLNDLELGQVHLTAELENIQQLLQQHGFYPPATGGATTAYPGAVTTEDPLVTAHSEYQVVVEGVCTNDQHQGHQSHILYQVDCYNLDDTLQKCLDEHNQNFPNSTTPFAVRGLVGFNIYLDNSCSDAALRHPLFADLEEVHGVVNVYLDGPHDASQLTAYNASNMFPALKSVNLFHEDHNPTYLTIQSSYIPMANFAPYLKGTTNLNMYGPGAINYNSFQHLKEISAGLTIECISVPQSTLGACTVVDAFSSLLFLGDMWAHFVDDFGPAVFSGFNELVSVGTLVVYGANIQNVTFPKLASAKTFQVEFGDNLSGLGQLSAPHLSVVSDSLMVLSTRLVDLGGLSGLKMVSGEFRLARNAILTDLSALQTTFFSLDWGPTVKTEVCNNNISMVLLPQFAAEEDFYVNGNAVGQNEDYCIGTATLNQPTWSPLMNDVIGLY